MPNHVINEVTFHNVTPKQQAAILKTVIGYDQSVDFRTLLPIPLNFWWGSVGQKEEKAFPGTALSWCTENWGTKWNAYGLSEQSIFQTDDSLTLTFQTAWGRPIGWLCALFNKHNLSFEYRYMSEGNDVGFIGSFTEDDESFMGSRWEEKQADEETTKHLYALLWGEEP